MRLVIKFGGTSLKTRKRLMWAAQQLKRLADEGHQLLIVVSAAGDETNRLMKLGRQIWPQVPFEQHYLQLIALGETRSASLLVLALGAQGLGAEAVGFFHPRFPLVATAGQAASQQLSSAKVNDPVQVTLDEEATRERFGQVIEPLLRKKIIPVIAGFFVRDGDGNLVSLGRGGSDVTAFLVGKYCRADEVVIVTDVAGVFSADPHQVAGARLLSELSADDLSALAHRGARVLHPNALRYKQESQAARVVHFRHLGRLHRQTGTRIQGATKTALAVRPEPLQQVLLFAKRLSLLPGVLGQLGGFFAEMNLPIHAMTQTGDVATLYLDHPLPAGLLEQLHKRFAGPAGVFYQVLQQGPVCEIALSNPAFIEAPGVIADISNTLGRAGINIVEIVTSHAAIVIYCGHDDGQRAAQLIRERLQIK